MIDVAIVLAGLAVLVVVGLVVRRWSGGRGPAPRREIIVPHAADVPLEQLESRLLGRTDVSTSTLWEWNAGTGKIQLAGRFVDLTGYDLEDVPRTVPEALELAHPDDRGRVQAIFEDYLAGRSPDCETECRLCCADGRYLWLRLRALATWDDHDRLLRLVGSFTDITARVEAEEQRVRLFNLSIDMLAVVGFDGVVQQLNPAWVRVLGWSRDDLMSRTLAEFTLEEDRHLMEEALAKLRDGQPLEGIECRLVCLDGSRRWLAFTAFPYPDRKTIFAVARDITAHKEAEEQQAVYQERLQHLRNQLSLVEDRQRRELADAIHDGLAQQLFGLRAQITLLKYPDRLSDYQGVVATAIEVLDETMVEARSLSFELFPQVLYQVGLEGALEWLAHQYQERTGQTCHFEVAGEAGYEDNLPQDLRAMAYQSVRELLNNVRKHATANRVDVVLDWQQELVRLSVVDDGCGFEFSDLDRLEIATATASGFGLFSIRERVRSVDGAMVIETSPGQGTSVHLDFPMPEETAAGSGG